MFRTALSIVCAMFCLSVTAAGEPLLQEEFGSLDGDRWSISLPATDARVWLGEFDGNTELSIGNGAVVKTTQSFKEHVDVTVWWAYESPNTDAEKQEQFTFAIRSDGKVKNGKLQNGLALHIHTVTGTIRLIQCVNGEEKVLQEKKVRIDADENMPAIPRGNGQNWYRFRIKDDGKTLSVVSTLDDVALEASYDASMHSENRIVIFNSRKPIEDENRTFIRHLLVKENQQK